MGGTGVRLSSHPGGLLDIASGGGCSLRFLIWVFPSLCISVCAGAGSIRVTDVRYLEITPLGYEYLSQLPPETVGYDASIARAHTPRRGRKICSSVPVQKIAHWLKNGELKWEDVADFYSRHSCERIQIDRRYRRATQNLERLPVLAGPKGD